MSVEIGETEGGRKMELSYGGGDEVEHIDFYYILNRAKLLQIGVFADFSRSRLYGGDEFPRFLEVFECEADKPIMRKAMRHRVYRHMCKCIKDNGLLREGEEPVDHTEFASLTSEEKCRLSELVKEGQVWFD